MTHIGLATNQLLRKLAINISIADTIYFLVSFVMQSGAELLAPHLREAAKRGVDIKILTGDYLYVTQPQGLKSICDIDSRIEVRLWQSHGVAFHPKAYMFHSDKGKSVLCVGSSNLSESALTSGVEWNLFAESADMSEVAIQAEASFMGMFYDDRTVLLNHESIQRYEEEYNAYHRANPHLAQMWTRLEEMGSDVSKGNVVETKVVEGKGQRYYHEIKPRPVQVEALHQLAQTREDGYDKALVVMATGLGKTYLAAIFAIGFRRVLFVAHREEILLQAKQAFEIVLPERSCGVFNGTQKEETADCVFASIFTLGMQRHRLRFQPNDFDLVIIDEFHHAAAKSYQNVIAYFQPSFLLGITATPDRADGRDVYAICDGNVAYKIDFIEAIQRDWLAPFRYIGVYDETDYSQIRWLGSRYDEIQLLAAQLKQSMASRIYEAWITNRQTRTIAFCSSIAQANFLADYFQQQGTRCLVLHSGTNHVNRKDAILYLGDGTVEVIFTVDLFNEGVDIPSVDTLLFVRPTESLTIFTQQIGRGLRLYPDKQFCTIIDLIGNYKNADTKLRLFNAADSGSRGNRVIIPVVPDNCMIQLDTQVIDLLEHMRQKRQPRRDQLLESYAKLKQDFGRRPTYVEMHLHGQVDSRVYRQEFGSYVGFLNWAGELNVDETIVYGRHEIWLKEVESTGMTKSYKMVVLLVMLERGQREWTRSITPNTVAPYFHAYYMSKEYRKRIDFSDKTTTRMWAYDEVKVAQLIANMPMAKWGTSSNGLLAFAGDEFQVLFSVEARDSEILYEWTREICEYRLHSYFERKGQGDKGEAFVVQ